MNSELSDLITCYSNFLDLTTFYSRLSYFTHNNVNYTCNYYMDNNFQQSVVGFINRFLFQILGFFLCIIILLDKILKVKFLYNFHFDI